MHGAAYKKPSAAVQHDAIRIHAIRTFDIVRTRVYIPRGIP